VHAQEKKREGDGRSERRRDVVRYVEQVAERPPEAAERDEDDRGERVACKG